MMMFTRIHPMDADDSRYSSRGYFSNEGMDHLTYLKQRPSIFENENDLRIRQRILICAACGQPVTKVSEKIEVLGRHDHAFVMLRAVSEWKASPRDIHGSGVTHGRFRSA